MKASHKRLKVVLALGVRNFGLASIALELVEFPLFDNFFSNLVAFQDLDVFSDFLLCSTPLPSPNPSTSLSLTPSRLGVSLFGSIVIFSIKISGAVILLKP